MSDARINPEILGEQDPNPLPEIEVATSENHRQADDALHQACTIYHPFGMCASCTEQYALGQRLGTEDFAIGVPLLDGALMFRAAHPEIPRVSGGAIEGYAHGWALAQLKGVVRRAGLSFVEGH